MHGKPLIRLSAMWLLAVSGCASTPPACVLPAPPPAWMMASPPDLLTPLNGIIFVSEPASPSSRASSPASRRMSDGNAPVTSQKE
ncbi:Rz1 family lipoprotein [Cronobacter dublinensis]|nr:Rz1 family lipoprotein [Cronobacter dublinensis]ELY9423073.1 Rz1 family lipoprotein [Cronobacter dublinensis]